MTGSHFIHLASAASGIAMLGAATLSAPATAAPPDNSHNPALPQFNVVGTDVMLHNSAYAEDASRAVADARRANDECSKILFQQSVAWVERHQYDASSRRGGATPYILTDTFGHDTNALKKLAAEMRGEWAARCEGKPKLQANTNSFTGGVGIHAGRVNLPTLAYLGFEDALTLDQTIGVVDGEDEGAVAGMSAQGSVNANAFKLELGGFWGAEIGFSRSGADVSSSFTNIDPAGDGLLIPGPLGGASGFALPSAGGLNVVSAAEFSASYDWTNVHAKFFMPVECETLLLFPFTGLGYTRTGFDARFEGSIPGFGRDFAYNTSVDVDAISPMAGLEVVRDFGGTSLRAGGLVAVDFNDADGRDRLSFTGFPDSEAMLENDDTTVSGRVWLGVTYGTAASPFALSLDVAWVRAGNVPNITRDGINPTRLDMDNADAFVGSLGAVVRF